MSRYEDLSAEVDARSRLDEVTPLSAVLSALRFESVGLVRVGSGGAVAELWRSPDRDAFAEPEWHPGRTPNLVFRTLFPDGTIVQTSSARQGLMRHLPLWVRQHHPAAGYLLEELVLPPHELWQRHQARVKELAAARGAPPPHDSMPLFLALAERSMRSTRFRGRMAQLLGVAVFLPVATYVTFAEAAPRWALPATTLVWILATGLAFRLARALPFPKRRALGALKNDPAPGRPSDSKFRQIEE